MEKLQHTHEHLYAPDLESNERSTLLGEADLSETDATFIPLLDHELDKMVLFYEQQQKELAEELNDLEKDVEFQETLGLQGGAHYADYEDGDDDDDDDESISSPRSPDARRSLSRPRKLSAAGRQRRVSRTLLTFLLFLIPLMFV